MKLDRRALTDFTISSWFAMAYQQPSGLPVYVPDACWKGYHFKYQVRGDSILTTSAMGFAVGDPALAPPIFFERNGELIAPYDIGGAPNEYRYSSGAPLTMGC